MFTLSVFMAEALKRFLSITPSQRRTLEEQHAANPPRERESWDCSVCALLQLERKKKAAKAPGPGSPGWRDTAQDTTCETPVLLSAVQSGAVL